MSLYARLDEKARDEYLAEVCPMWKAIADEAVSIIQDLIKSMNDGTLVENLEDRCLEVNKVYINHCEEWEE